MLHNNITKGKYLLLAVLFFFNVNLFTSCEKPSANEDTNDPQNSISMSDKPDLEGNLVITNNSGEVLILCDPSGKPIKKIWSTLTDFLVNIPNPQGSRVDLFIYKYSDIASNNNNLPPKPYKRWTIALDNSTQISKRMTWIVSSDASQEFCGSLTFSYVGGTEYQVEVFLNNKNGAKILTLAAGQQYRKTVGVDYGNYTILYHYYYSDPNSNLPPQDIAWVEYEMVNSQNVFIWAILNADRKEIYRQIPHYDVGPIGGTEYGSIKIINNSPNPRQIWIDDKLIENVMWTDKPIKNMSTIPANSNQTYTLQTGIYNFFAKDLITAGPIVQLTDTITKNQTITWVINLK